MTGVFIRDTDTHTENTMWPRDHRSGDWGDVYSQGKPRIAGNHRMLGRGKKDLPLKQGWKVEGGTSKHGPGRNLYFRLLAQRTVKE